MVLLVAEKGTHGLCLEVGGSGKGQDLAAKLPKQKRK